MRQPRVSFTVADGRVHVVVYGVAEGIDADPGWRDADQRRVLRITPRNALSHE